MRARIAQFILGLGVMFAVVAYFFLAAPIGPPPAPVRAIAELLGAQAAIDVPAAGPAYSDPRVLGAPLIFILGIMLVFISAVVYELLPDRRPQQD